MTQSPNIQSKFPEIAFGVLWSIGVAWLNGTIIRFENHKSGLVGRIR